MILIHQRVSSHTESKKDILSLKNDIKTKALKKILVLSVLEITNFAQNYFGSFKINIIKTICSAIQKIASISDYYENTSMKN